jgi:hypothetical protein
MGRAGRGGGGSHRRRRGAGLYAGRSPQRANAKIRATSFEYGCRAHVFGRLRDASRLGSKRAGRKGRADRDDHGAGDVRAWRARSPSRVRSAGDGAFGLKHGWRVSDAVGARALRPNIRRRAIGERRRCRRERDPAGSGPGPGPDAGRTVAAIARSNGDPAGKSAGPVREQLEQRRQRHAATADELARHAPGLNGGAVSDRPEHADDTSGRANDSRAVTGFAAEP